MAVLPSLLARGPWEPGQVDVLWRDDSFQPSDEVSARADAEIEALRKRGSPSHDGLSARLSGYDSRDGRLELELQAIRWAVRLVDGEASDALTALCVVRAADGRWLAGRRASWVSTWSDRWALGAGGAVDMGESPVTTLSRELQEEWQLEPEQLRVEMLIRVPSGMTMLVGLATVSADAEAVPDDEHDEFAWWPREVSRWPSEADPRLRLMGNMLARDD